MKIAVWHNLPSGGGKRALYYHVRGLVQRGHEVESWRLDTADDSYLPLSDLTPEHVCRYEFKRRKRSRWLAGGFRETMARMQAFEEACKQSAREIAAGDFDLLFANTALDYHVPYVMRHLRIPKVLYLQEPCRYMYEAQPILPWISQRRDSVTKTRSFRPMSTMGDYARLQALRSLAKREWVNARACDTILANSYFSRESIVKAYAVDAKVCYLGVDTSLFQNLALERERFIVGLGSFHSIKGIDLAVKAVSLISQPRPPLVWISNSGNEAYMSEVKQLASSLGVELRIRMAISDAELVSTLNKADLLICTSRLEPFGFAPLEANACGLPVVAVEEGGVRETIQNGLNGFLVEPEPEKIARAADRLLQNPGLARQMGDNAALHVQRNWSVEHSVDRLEAFLEQAVSVARAKPPKAVARINGSNKEQPNIYGSAQVVLRSSHSEGVKTLPRRAMCTIIAKNYLAFARTLAQSFLSLHPDHKCYVLIVDDFEGFINPADECFEIINLADLEIPNLQNLCFKYGVTELCTAVKARLLEYLVHEKSLDGLLYLDPDILVTARLDGLFERLATYDIVLTPHLDTDFPDDGLHPNDGHILRAGLFNLGFIGINSSQNAASFLNWWKLKLYERCVVDLLSGYFVDQKFIDFVPHFFRNVFIEKDVGYNVAYWNLHSRRLSRDNGLWKCNGAPLYFFHFSGYSPKNKRISTYIHDKQRHQFSNRPDLKPLFSEYKKLLIANGHERAKPWSYSYGYFQTREPIPNELRIFYRNSPGDWARYGDPFESWELKRRAVSDFNGSLSPVLERELEAGESEPDTLAAKLLEKEFQLNAILNSRAWRWICRCARFKNRYFLPVYGLFGRLLRSLRGIVSQEDAGSLRYRARQTLVKASSRFILLSWPFYVISSAAIDCFKRYD
jgi:glycosyltransferase involved in cell wall biosynthesis